MKVIVVGGGTSGLMASVSAALAGAEVILLDKTSAQEMKSLNTSRETDASYIVPFPNLITKTLLSFSKTEEFN